MLKSITLFSLAILLSLAILGPSFIALLEHEADIELVSDFDEESSKETKKELEESEKFFNDLLFLPIESNTLDGLAYFFYREKMYGHILDVHSPPPQQMI